MSPSNINVAGVTGICLTALAGILIYLAANAFYQIFLSPLRRIPGPLLAKVTPYYLTLIDTAGNRTSTIHEWHQQYGTAVRIGPSEISFSNTETVKEIYGPATPYMKSLWYQHMAGPPLGIFALSDRRAHAERRRLLAPVFAQNNLLEAEPLIKQKIDNLVNRIKKANGHAVDMLGSFRAFSLDVVGELFLGKSFDALQSEITMPMLEDSDLLFLLMGIKYSFPLIHWIICHLPIPSVKRFSRAPDRVDEQGRTAYFEYIDQHGRNSGRKDLLTKFLSQKDQTDGKSFTDHAAYREVINLLFAGTDTTSTTLTYLFWELAKHPKWQDRLRKELDSVESISWLRVVDLPILEAVVEEALRLHPAAPASLPRLVPTGGRVLDDHFIPEGTVVSMQCYTTQRDPSAFPDPGAFKPERWRDSSKVTDRMRELFMPFSKGSRACLGKTLAMMELKLATAALIKEFDVKLAPSATEECMTMTDHFLVIPKGGKCELVLAPV